MSRCTTLEHFTRRFCHGWLRSSEGGRRAGRDVEFITAPAWIWRSLEHRSMEHRSRSLRLTASTCPPPVSLLSRHALYSSQMKRPCTAARLPSSMTVADLFDWLPVAVSLYIPAALQGCSVADGNGRMSLRRRVMPDSPLTAGPAMKPFRTMHPSEKADSNLVPSPCTTSKIADVASRSSRIVQNFVRNASFRNLAPTQL